MKHHSENSDRETMDWIEVSIKSDEDWLDTFFCNGEIAEKLKNSQLAAHSLSFE